MVTFSEPDAALRDWLEAHGTLHTLIQAGAEIVDVVEQDEFTLDIVARLPVNSQWRLAIFDTT